ncbi:MAG: AAA family ATPase [Actinomycetia bacterium]|nr:AAA family ATPase [Actinomycetes bacterium]
MEKIFHHKKEDRPKKNARIIAITNQKGGVGKSTTAVNVSAYLSSYGHRTLLIDLDPQSNSTSGMGINLEDINNSIYDVLISNVDPHEVIMDTAYKNLWLLPSSIQLAGAEVELVSSLKREYRLTEAVKKIKNEYDFIIIDCPPALGLLTINALSSAKEVIIPIQCEYYALEGLGQLMNTIELVRKNLNENLKISGAIMTMYDSRTKLGEQVIEEVRNYFQDKMYKTIIPRNIRLSEAPSYGKPIIEYDPDCRGAQAYNNFTKEVIENG